jgi:hypothetical protein
MPSDVFSSGNSAARDPDAGKALVHLTRDPDPAYDDVHRQPGRRRCHPSTRHQLRKPVYLAVGSLELDGHWPRASMVSPRTMDGYGRPVGKPIWDWEEALLAEGATVRSHTTIQFR